MLLAEVERRDALALLDDLGSTVAGPDADEEMDMIRLDGQLQNLPPFVLALARNDTAAVLCHSIDKDRLASLRAPDEVKNDEVNTVFVALIFHAGIVRPSTKESTARR
jgi:hypothetical protein